ncbi:MAG TPA: hypothetical protein VN442_24715 [Bryobacteraceae bacterium]|nr:hypothetical protein [Bryobacteraceae bacterium]
MMADARNMPNVVVIGLSPEEHDWVRLLVSLLRDPDPVRGELTRQALIYLESRPERQAPT